ncbi:MaoC family dehydratase [Hirschia baltica]|uniref:Enoyl-CoA hydratase n=1 Tax=Hirschia baltica (strain ATCC 49814 / DSM 5838 / IFAM 1418) TaxID=582402 RepID=C6XQX9_HIRBI|nr:MaoC family dehydratase [Hirschia baltica]ACT60510.1 Enoyl-CoA hydratase [Hirschia baltica ATCC 49814]
MTSLAELQSKVGETLGTSEWIEIGQDRINTFADVTEDHQFIHLDAEAAAKTPFGGTIAHGFLTLSLMSKMSEDAMPVLDGIAMAVNYGSDKVRFIHPVPSGSRIRGHFKLLNVDVKNPKQILIKAEGTVEIENIEKPAMIVEMLTMQFLK